MCLGSTMFLTFLLTTLWFPHPRKLQLCLFSHWMLSWSSVELHMMAWPAATILLKYLKKSHCWFLPCVHPKIHIKCKTYTCYLDSPLILGAVHGRVDTGFWEKVRTNGSNTMWNQKSIIIFRLSCLINKIKIIDLFYRQFSVTDWLYSGKKIPWLDLGSKTNWWGSEKGHSVG